MENKEFKIHLNKNNFDIKLKSKMTYMVIGFLAMFCAILVGNLIEDYLESLKVLNAINKYHYFVMPVTIGVIAAIFSLFYWNKQNQQIEIAKILLESENRFKTIFYKNSSVCLVIEPGTKKILDANEAALQFYGYKYDEITSLRISDINVLSDDEIEEEFQSTQKSDKKYLIFQHKLKSGVVKYVEVYRTPIIIDKSEYFFSIIYDVSERKQAEEMNKMLRHSMDVYTDGIYWMDNNNIFVYANEEGGRAFGCTPEELIGKSLYDVNPTTTPETLADLWHQLRTNGIFTAETVHRRFDGSEFYVEIRSVYIHYEGKEYNNGYARDITKRKLIEKELIKAKEKAEESDRLKSNFLLNMSHEIRTPLNAIVGFTGLMLKSDIAQDKRRLYTEMISISSDKLIEIITDVIEISQVQTNQIRVKYSRFDIISNLNRIFSIFKYRTNNTKVELKLNLKIEYPEFYINSDFEKLNRIIIHLLDNALKFTTKGTVEIVCEIINENLNISVSDTGIGISAEMQKNIFEPFFQVETGTIRNYGGNGLGLSLIKAFTELLNGSVTLESEINLGSTFTVSIPLVIKSELESKKETPVKKNSVNTILIAEDEYSNFLYLVNLLENTGINILHASNGQQALDMCRNNNNIDIVLMDIKMPVMDGHSATKLIKSFRPGLTIIAQTAFALESEMAGFINDFDDYLTKPIKAFQLKQKLNKYMVNKIDV